MPDQPVPPDTKPYLIRAIHEWCCDNGFTPYLAVVVDGSTRVPVEFVRDGQIVLNVSVDATNRLRLGNEFIEFQARFGGVARDIVVPIANVAAIYARENSVGMAFEIGEESVAAEVDEDVARPVPSAPSPLRLAGAPESSGNPAEDEEPPEAPPPSRPPSSSAGRPRLQRVK
jgi:stringent starvation protein B